MNFMQKKKRPSVSETPLFTLLFILLLFCFLFCGKQPEFIGENRSFPYLAFHQNLSIMTINNPARNSKP
jgi:hypothetical protein